MLDLVSTMNIMRIVTNANESMSSIASVQESIRTRPEQSLSVFTTSGVIIQVTVFLMRNSSALGATVTVSGWSFSMCLGRSTATHSGSGSTHGSKGVEIGLRHLVDGVIVIGVQESAFLKLVNVVQIGLG